MVLVMPHTATPLDERPALAPVRLALHRPQLERLLGRRQHHDRGGIDIPLLGLADVTIRRFAGLHLPLPRSAASQALHQIGMRHGSPGLPAGRAPHAILLCCCTISATMLANAQSRHVCSDLICGRISVAEGTTSTC